MLAYMKKKQYFCSRLYWYNMRLARIPLVHEHKHSLAKGTRRSSLSPKIKIFGDPKKQK